MCGSSTHHGEKHAAERMNLVSCPNYFPESPKTKPPRSLSAYSCTRPPIFVAFGGVENEMPGEKNPEQQIPEPPRPRASLGDLFTLFGSKIFPFDGQHHQMGRFLNQNDDGPRRRATKSVTSIPMPDFVARPMADPVARTIRLMGDFLVRGGRPVADLVARRAAHPMAGPCLWSVR